MGIKLIQMDTELSLIVDIRMTLETCTIVCKDKAGERRILNKRPKNVEISITEV